MHQHQEPPCVETRGDEGFLLIGAIVLVFLVILLLSLAAPRVAREIQRDREVESAHRAQQYVRAIRVYYLKFKHYPASIEELEKTNNQRFLRQKYTDPLTNKDDWRMIQVGQNQTKVKGLFGEDLPGLQAGLGSAAGMSSSSGTSSSIFGPATGGTAAGTGAGAGSSGLGSGPGSGPGSGLGGSGGGLGTGPGNAPGNTPAAPGGSGSGNGLGGMQSQSATDFKGSGGQIMGVGSARSGESMLIVNDQTTYETWEFLYDPRIEQMYAKASLIGGVGSAGPGTAPIGIPPSPTGPANSPGPK